MYRKLIQRVLDAARLDYDPALVEAWMRKQNGTLDGMDRLTFGHEVMVAAALTRHNPDVSRELAVSYGLEVRS